MYMSKIGDTYGLFNDELELSLEDYQEERQRSKNAMDEFYPAFFHTLVRKFDWTRTRNDERWQTALRLLKEQFGHDEESLHFAAIDGTSGKKQLSEMLVFYGASYAQAGELDINESIGQLEYKRWSPSEDTSVIAYLPIPLNRLNQYEDEDWVFRGDDTDRAAAAVIHNTVMQLAEIYLAYRKITSEDRPVNILLFDHSISSILNSTNKMDLIHPYHYEEQTLGWIGAWIDRWARVFEPADGLVTYSHPMNADLQVPSSRVNALSQVIVAHLTDFWQITTINARYPGTPLNLSDLFDELGIDSSDMVVKDRIIQRIKKTGTDPVKGLRAFEIIEGKIFPINRLENGKERTLRERWNDLRELFEYICVQLFREKNTKILQLHYPNEGKRRGTKWMDHNDIGFLIGLGLRLIIELCWQKNILLIGVAKDSASRYLTRNYLSVLKTAKLIDLPETAEPPGSDRLTCETIPYMDHPLCTLGRQSSLMQFL